MSNDTMTAKKLMTRTVENVHKKKLDIPCNVHQRASLIDERQIDPTSNSHNAVA